MKYLQIDEIFLLHYLKSSRWQRKNACLCFCQKVPLALLSGENLCIKPQKLAEMGEIMYPEIECDDRIGAVQKRIDLAVERPYCHVPSFIQKDGGSGKPTDIVGGRK